MRKLSIIKNKFIHLTIIILCLLMAHNISSQTKVYFDKDWKKTSKEAAVYHRIIDKKNDSLFYIKDYYSNGKLQMEGHFSNLEKETLEKKVIWYTKEGKIDHISNYKKGILHGMHTVYLKNGKINYSTEYKNGYIYSGVYAGGYYKQYYKNGKLTKQVELEAPNNFRSLKTRVFGLEKDTIYWMSNKGDKLIGIGIYSSSSSKIIDGLEIDNNFLIAVHTNYKDGKREGVQKVFYKGKLLTEQTFANNIVVLERSINPLNHKTVEINFKNGEPYTGQLFQFNQVYNYYNEFIYNKGIVIIKNHYELIDGKLKLNKEKSYKLK